MTLAGLLWAETHTRCVRLYYTAPARPQPQSPATTSLGIPVSGSLSFRARRGFFPCARTDQMTLWYCWTIFPGDVTLAELGSGHSLMDRQLDITTVALAITVRWEEDHSGPAPQVQEVATPHQ